MKGQWMAFKLLMFFIALVVFVIFLPSINDVVTSGLASSVAAGDTMTGIIFQLTPFILLIAMCVWLFIPRGEA